MAALTGRYRAGCGDGLLDALGAAESTPGRPDRTHIPVPRGNRIVSPHLIVAHCRKRARRAGELA